MDLFKESGWPQDAVFNKLETDGRLEGDEALAYLAAQFSNATKNNYEAQSLFERTQSSRYTVIVVDTSRSEVPA